ATCPKTTVTSRPNISTKNRLIWQEQYVIALSSGPTEALPVCWIFSTSFAGLQYLFLATSTNFLTLSQQPRDCKLWGNAKITFSKIHTANVQILQIARDA